MRGSNPIPLLYRRAALTERQKQVKGMQERSGMNDSLHGVKTGCHG
jgi:hypothetical protein